LINTIEHEPTLDDEAKVLHSECNAIKADFDKFNDSDDESVKLLGKMGEVVMKRNAEIVEERRRVHCTKPSKKTLGGWFLIEAPVATVRTI
jgi:hypothetical protein